MVTGRCKDYNLKPRMAMCFVQLAVHRSAAFQEPGLFFLGGSVRQSSVP